MTNKRIFYILIVFLFIISCNNKKQNIPNIPLESNYIQTVDSIEDIDLAIEAEDCIFDTSSYKFTSEILLKHDKNIRFSWNNEDKKAKTVFENGDTLYLSIGGCYHFGYYAILHTNIPFEQKDSLFRKTAWVAESFFESGFKDYNKFIHNGNYILNKEVSDDEFQHFDMSLGDSIPINYIYNGFDFQKNATGTTTITISGYID